MTKVIEFIGALKDGGAETLVKDYAALLDQERMDVTILTVYPIHNTANYILAVKTGTRILSVYRRYNLLTKIVNKILGKWYVPFRLRKILALEAPDCIHINSPLAWQLAEIRHKLKGIKLVYTCHSEPDRYFAIGNKREEDAVRKLVRENDMCLIALHDDMRIELNKRFGIENTIVVNNGVNFSQYRRPEWVLEQIRDSIGMPRDAFILVHVGRFAAVKNHLFLLDVFSEIKKRKENSYLLLIGDGPLKSNICEKIDQLGLNDYVTMLSHRTDVPELLYASDLVIFPSKYEGLSVVLIEMQVSGLRCVVSDAVNRANFLTEDTIPMSLKSGAEKWADVALDKSIKNPSYGNIQEFDLNQEICKLEYIYTQ